MVHREVYSGLLGVRGRSGKGTLKEERAWRRAVKESHHLYLFSDEKIIVEWSLYMRSRNETSAVWPTL